ncbi:bifunctional metallophosphatase/5'-nucleotidase, partial [Levilactobacillus brevis]|nr:bifunctional metallophosphatase/5'-nucleotidase [Levilactobacillus brevis]
MRIVHQHKLLYSLLVPLLVVGSTTTLSNLGDTAQAAKVTTQTDKYRVPTSQPGFKKVAKKYKQA